MPFKVFHFHGADDLKGSPLEKGRYNQYPGHSPDPIAANKYPGSVSGSRWTAQIKIGNKQLKSDGAWTKNQSLNEVHIPIEGK